MASWLLNTLKTSTRNSTPQPPAASTTSFTVAENAALGGHGRFDAVSALVRRVQSGYIYHYAMAMIIGVFLLMTYFVWLAK